MPTPLLANDILRVVVACRLPSKAQNGLNVLHYKVTTAGGMNLEQTPLAFYNRFVTQYAAWLPTVAQFSGVSVTRVATVTRPAAGPFYQAFPQNGLASTGVLPLQASGIIRLTTPGDDQVDPPIKASKGRVYIPFPAITSYSEGTGTLATLGMSRLDAIRAVLGPNVALTGGAILVQVMKRTKTNAPPAPPTVLGYTPVTAMLAMRAIATQRRRGDFGRINAAFGGII